MGTTSSGDTRLKKTLKASERWLELRVLKLVRPVGPGEVGAFLPLAEQKYYGDYFNKLYLRTLFSVQGLMAYRCLGVDLNWTGLITVTCFPRGLS